MKVLRTVFIYSFVSCASGFWYETSYRPKNWTLIESRLAQDWLATWELIGLGGGSSKAYTCAHKKICLEKYAQSCHLAPLCTLTMADLQLSWFQNFKHGLFTGIYALPVRSVKVTQESHANTVTHPGDTRLYLGWTVNYMETCYLDFVDVTIMLGALFPTSNRANMACPTPLSTGFNHHWGGIASATCALGLYDWLTIGCNGEGIFLAERTFTYSPGTVWSLSPYLKADHLIKGISLLAGYSFEQKRADRLNLCCPPPCAQQRTDRHVVHIVAEWDGQTYEHPHRPRIQLIYNQTVAGRNIVATNTGGGLLAFDVVIHW